MVTTATAELQLKMKQAVVASEDLNVSFKCHPVVTIYKCSLTLKYRVKE